MSIKTLTSQILTKFPTSRISFCSAFVSSNATQPVEVLFCVDDLYKWHDENIAMNPSLYSFMRFFGSTMLTQMQTRSGANVYCHPRIRFDNDRMIQYETVSMGDFCYDLNHWAELHVAGHLHKPIETIVAAKSLEMASAIENNTQSALRVALLLLPEQFSYWDLFMEIAQFSYNGKQFKTTIQKNREAIRKVVEPNLQEYFQFYLPHLKQHFSHCVQLPDPHELSDGKIRQDKSKEMSRKHFLDLPSATLVELKELAGSHTLTDKVIDFYIENANLLETNLREGLIQTVGRAHRDQELKDLMTAMLPNTMQKLFSNGSNRL